MKNYYNLLCLQSDYDSKFNIITYPKENNEEGKFCQLRCNKVLAKTDT